MTKHSKITVSKIKPADLDRGDLNTIVECDGSWSDLGCNWVGLLPECSRVVEVHRGEHESWTGCPVCRSPVVTTASVVPEWTGTADSRAERRQMNGCG